MKKDVAYFLVRETEKKKKKTTTTTTTKNDYLRPSLIQLRKLDKIQKAVTKTTV